MGRYPSPKRVVEIQFYHVEDMLKKGNEKELCLLKRPKISLKLNFETPHEKK